ncbi:MAG: hypothetical protein ABSG22_10615 [Sedimentisphaerales bacterium]
MPPDKDDLNRIHNRIDELVKSVGSMATDVATIATKLELMPEAPTRPCRELEEHLEEHKETKKSWKDALAAAGVDIAKITIVAAIAYLIGHGNI